MPTPGTNDFQVFDPNSINIETQAQYLTDPNRLNGVVTGTASSTLANKTWRQASSIASMIGQFIANLTGQNAIDDGTITTLLTNFQSAIPLLIVTEPNTWTKPQTFVDPNNDAGAIVISGAASSVGANIELIGNGGTTPNKFIRVLNGVLNVVNSAYSAVITSLDDVGNLTVAGGFTTLSGGVSSATYVQAAGNVVGNYVQGVNVTASGGSLAATVNVTAGNDVLANSVIQAANYLQSLGGPVYAGTYLYAGTGAFNTGNPNIGVILGDFGLDPTNYGYVLLPNGFIYQWGTGTFGNGADQVVNLPIAFPNAALHASASFAAAPTANNWVGAATANNSQIYVGLIATVANTVYFEALGF